jgi:hypothetical protein
LRRARAALYAITGGSVRSGDVRLARLTTGQRTAFFRSEAFRDWVKYENLMERQVFWLKDVDKTQAAGDIFTFFLKWRLGNGKLTQDQLSEIECFLLTKKDLIKGTAARLTRFAWSLPRLAGGKRRPLGMGAPR